MLKCHVICIFLETAARPEAVRNNNKERKEISRLRKSIHLPRDLL